MPLFSRNLELKRPSIVDELFIQQCYQMTIPFKYLTLKLRELLASHLSHLDGETISSSRIRKRSCCSYKFFYPWLLNINNIGRIDLDGGTIVIWFSDIQKKFSGKKVATFSVHVHCTCFPLKFLQNFCNPYFSLSLFTCTTI